MHWNKAACAFNARHTHFTKKIRNLGKKQKGKSSDSSDDSLAIFANSAPSYYMPGDTAADSDILPKEVLEDDGSQSDEEAAKQWV
jgi:hypothetical protein